MTVQPTGFRATWKSPTRDTEAEAQDDMNRVLRLLALNAPDLMSVTDRAMHHADITSERGQTEPPRPVPGAEACDDRSRG